MLSVTAKAANGIVFAARLVHKGDFYGLNDCLCHDKDKPLVEFYDTRWRKEFGHHLGQFVARYDYQDLFNSMGGSGLMLDGGNSEWCIDSTTYRGMISALNNLNTANTIVHCEV